MGGAPETGDVMAGEKVAKGAESVAPCFDAVASLDGIRVIRIDDGYAVKPEALKTSEAAGMGSREPDAEVGAAIERLAGRFGYRFTKRAFDIVFSVAVLVLLSWLFLIVAIAIKVDDPKGPVFFGQERVGKDGKRFRMWKFRSMVSDAEARLEGLQTKNEKTGPVFKMKDDPRVTRVGRLIRKTSIDELPQFLNVFLSRIPLRILKTRSEFSGKSMGAFALPAKSSTNKEKAFSQVVSCFASDQRMHRISGLNCNRISGPEIQFLAKPVFMAVRA